MMKMNNLESHLKDRVDYHFCKMKEIFLLKKQTDTMSTMWLIEDAKYQAHSAAYDAYKEVLDMLYRN